jgi:hypothetical protein
MEIGSTFAQLVTTHPLVCAHFFGQILDAFDVDHVLWGTDSIWYGTPQWQIEAFRRFQIPELLMEKHRYQALTRDVKTKIFGLNAARLFRVDVRTVRHALPKDAVGRLRMSYREEGTDPSHRLGGGIGGLVVPGEQARSDDHVKDGARSRVHDRTDPVTVGRLKRAKHEQLHAIVLSVTR